MEMSHHPHHRDIKHTLLRQLSFLSHITTRHHHRWQLHLEISQVQTRVGTVSRDPVFHRWARYLADLQVHPVVDLAQVTFLAT
jgi:hypothetical protein